MLLSCRSVVLAALLALPAFGGAEPPAHFPGALPVLRQPGSGQVFYFVMTDRFENGDPANDRGGMAGSAEQHGFDPTRISHYHGGDFVGLTRRLDYIQGLGATAIWITPHFVNKPVQAGTAGYHGYWIVDFLRVDPHLGTDVEFREFVRQAHARGLKVYLDIVANHTADVISYADGATDYRALTQYPLKDAAGRAISAADYAYNGVKEVEFPELDARTSFAHIPTLAPAERHVKSPEWLNDVTLYHNRGNSTFKGENSLYGDFVGLDDTLTEHPRVVRGFIDVFKHWVREYRVDGFRIDTAKHVNREFWQAFCPALQEEARKDHLPEFFMFGEVSVDTDGPEFLSLFSTEAAIDATLDFAFFGVARDFVSVGKGSEALYSTFSDDDFYTDHDSNAHGQTTFLDNHDRGRFGYFLKKDNPGASDERALALERFGHALLLLTRGQPVVYYGDEQGMVGIGDDMGAREDMFATQAPEFRELSLIGTQRNGVDDKFDPTHPLYRTIRSLARLRQQHAALREGAMILQPSPDNRVFAFSRIHRDERVEFLAAFNNSRTSDVVVDLPVVSGPGVRLRRIHDEAWGTAGGDQVAVVTKDGNVRVRLKPLDWGVWRAEVPVSSRAAAAEVVLRELGTQGQLEFRVGETDGHRYVRPVEIGAEVKGGDGLGEVTFLLARRSRPGQYELLGTDDAPPYRVYWRPPADWAEGEEVEFFANYNDLRDGGTARAPEARAARSGWLRVGKREAPSGIAGAVVPVFSKLPPARITAENAGEQRLVAQAEGTGQIQFQWYKNGERIQGATTGGLTLTGKREARAGRYTVTARNAAGTAVSPEIVVE